MWKADLKLIKKLHEKHNFQAPLCEPGGLSRPVIANYEKSIEKAHRFVMNLENRPREIVVPHSEQKDRYENILRPWSFIDENYLILNPERGEPGIEDLPKDYAGKFNTVILVSVFEHTENPYICAEALFQILKTDGYLINCVPWIFPEHDAIDNWRFSENSLRKVHEAAGFEIVESGYHIDYSFKDGIGNYHNADEVQTIKGCYVLCRKPK